MFAWPARGVMAYPKETISSWWRDVSGWPDGGWPADSGYLRDLPSGRLTPNGRHGAVIVHEVFHLLRFRHPYDPFVTYTDDDPGVPMVRGPLWKASEVGAWIHYPAWEDIEALRCIFPAM